MLMDDGLGWDAILAWNSSRRGGQNPAQTPELARNGKAANPRGSIFKLRLASTIISPTSLSVSSLILTPQCDGTTRCSSAEASVLLHRIIRLAVVSLIRGQPLRQNSLPLLIYNSPPSLATIKAAWHIGRTACPETGGIHLYRWLRPGCCYGALVRNADYVLKSSLFSCYARIASKWTP